MCQHYAAAAQHLRELRLLRRVRDRIHRECDQDLDIEALARDVQMPAQRLSREFGRAYGESPHSYLTACRAGRTSRT